MLWDREDVAFGTEVVTLYLLQGLEKGRRPVLLRHICCRPSWRAPLVGRQRCRR